MHGHASPTWLEGRATWNWPVVIGTGNYKAHRCEVSDHTPVPEAFHRGAIEQQHQGQLWVISDLQGRRIWSGECESEIKRND